MGWFARLKFPAVGNEIREEDLIQDIEEEGGVHVQETDGDP